MPVSTGLEYSHEVHGQKMFLKLGWRIFGGKFIRFMGGFKNDGQVVGQDTFILA